MTAIKTLLCLSAACLFPLTSISAVIEFELGPNGLSGQNERPIPVTTTASGGEVVGEPGISYDTDTKHLFLNFGWGDVFGYTDLTGNWLGVTLNGPAGTEAEGNQLYNLAPLVSHVTTTDGGVVQKGLPLTDLSPGGVAYSVAQQEADLMDGLWYINVRSGSFPGGELRGQLTVVPEPSTYAAITGLALLCFAGWRRMKMKRA